MALLVPYNDWNRNLLIPKKDFRMVCIDENRGSAESGGIFSYVIAWSRQKKGALSVLGCLLGRQYPGYES